MELAIRSRYYEGSGLTLNEVGPDGKMKEVLSVGCGA